MNQIFFDTNIYSLITVEDILFWTVNQFSNSDIWYGHGTDNPWDEAIQLVLPSLHMPLNISKNMLTMQVTPKERNCIINRVICRITKYIPVAYLTNKSWFCGHEFYIDTRVLIPRSPISELINNHFSGLIYQEPKYILDMCTGSGCIGIACAYSFPESKIDLVDISTDALVVAKKNVEKHNLMKRLTIIHSNLFWNLPKFQYDLIVTNPPYVDEESMSNLPNEYRYEPELSFRSGNDGLKLIHRILACASDYLNRDGILICEVGNSMIQLVKKYPYVPFIWLNFSNGGNGVFMINKEQLIISRKYFSIHKFMK